MVSWLRAGRWWGAAGTVLLLLMAAAPGARAESARGVVDELEGLLKTYRWGPAGSLLTEEAVAVIAADAEQLRRATCIVAGASLAWATAVETERPPDALAEAQAVQDALLPAALTWLESEEGTDVERTTMSLLLLAVGVVRRQNREPYAEVMIRGAEAHHAWYAAHVKERQHAPDGISLLLVAAEDPKANVKACLDTAADWAIEYGALLPGGISMRQQLAHVRRRQAEQAFEKKQRSAASRYATEAVEHLFAVAQERKNDDKVVDAYHELVRWASREGLVRKAQIVPRDKRVDPEFVSFVLPRGTAWTYEYGKDQHRWTAKRRTMDSPWMILSAYRYSWDILYTSPDGDFTGDNLKGLLSQDEDSDKLEFGNRARWKRNLRSALNENHRKADGYEVIGEMDDGVPARVRRWYVKDPSRRYTIGITLTVLATETEGRATDATALDAEVEAILDSIEIIPRD